MHVTSRDEILGVAGLYREEVYIKAWDKSVWLRELTLRERLDLEAETSASDERDEGQEKLEGIEMLLRMLLLCAETPDRQPLFRSEDMDMLRDSSGAGVSEAGMAALRINRMRVEDIEELKKS